jgi:hypothetical protein
LLGWFFVLAVGMTPTAATAQFVATSGLTAPAVLPSPLLNYGAFVPPALGMGFGFGWTNWMQNPYEGYLNGAANVTTANAQYQLTIQQAKLAREEARRSALRTRRAAIEERQYELSLLPDAEKIRQDQMMRSLERSRNNPPLTEIWAATALNDLLRDIQGAHTRGISGPEVSLSPEVLRHINTTTGTTYGGIGLLREGGKLTWPAVLRQTTFETERKQLDELLPQAVTQAQSGEVSAETLGQLNTAAKELERAIDARATDLSSTEYIQAARYLRELKESLRVLQQSDVAKYFQSGRTPQGATVADLVRQMTKEGLRFAPAVSGDQAYYTALHRSLVEYDYGLAQLRATAPRP